MTARSVVCLTAVVLLGCYDPAEPLPDAVRDAVGDYDLVAAVTTDGDSLPIDRALSATIPTGVNCNLGGSDLLIRTIGLDGYLTLSEVDRATAGTLTVYGLQCNDSVMVGTLSMMGTYVLQERYLTLTSPFGGPFGGLQHPGEFDADAGEIAFAYPGAGFVIVAIFSGQTQIIALERARWRRVRP
jgi:hypothetical protein